MKAISSIITWLSTFPATNGFGLRMQKLGNLTKGARARCLACAGGEKMTPVARSIRLHSSSSAIVWLSRLHGAEVDIRYASQRVPPPIAAWMRRMVIEPLSLCACTRSRRYTFQIYFLASGMRYTRTPHPVGVLDRSWTAANKTATYFVVAL